MAFAAIRMVANQTHFQRLSNCLRIDTSLNLVAYQVAFLPFIYAQNPKVLSFQHC